jgi:hypothetical protein
MALLATSSRRPLVGEPSRYRSAVAARTRERSVHTFRGPCLRLAGGQGITVSDAAAGEPSISARSTALGDAIGAGESRWYFVLYRDPTVLGGCAPGTTFNATPTRQASWAP